MFFSFPDATRQSCYVAFRGKVYDISSFLPDHPGGDDVILEYAGKDIGAVMGDEDSHVHSRSAYEMMEEYCVGELGGDEQIVSESECDAGYLGYKLRDSQFRLGTSRGFPPRRDRHTRRLQPKQIPRSV